MKHSLLEPYTKGTIAWFSDEEEGWITAILSTITFTDTHVKMQFKTSKQDRIIDYESVLEKLVASNFTDLPPLKNPPGFENIDDLAELAYLHEADVLHTIKHRYRQEQIYTYSGIVLVAMNPFAKMGIYTTEIMRQYSGRKRDELEPHLFAIAEEAYRAMMRDGKNQSVVVSGESGAGKTQSAKYIMRYFATVDSLDKPQTFSRHGSQEVSIRTSTSNAPGNTEIEEAVLSTNPIMEAFGNAKTTRNDNSSRFGKYIEILFTKPEDSPEAKVSICGARVRTYLLERSRLIMQPTNERNYHIFYQICAATPAAERHEYGLESWEAYSYLNQGNTGTIHGVDEISEFAITQKALSSVGIAVATQWHIFKICSALLHIGNIKIIESNEQADISDDDPALLQATKLLGLNPSDFKKWTIKKQIITRSESIITNLNSYSATIGRDSLSKFIYSMLFDWLVKITNKNLAKDEAKSGSFIGVLDIYGFEHFKKNSFEQFCINYANEKLQQEFNQHVFKLQQEEYMVEQIPWSLIDFNDNRPCIDLIENKLGILDLLDEESRLPSGTDTSLIGKLHQKFGVATQKFFEKPRFGEKAFTIKHYACDVSYDIEGFLEKNKDTVSDEQMELLKNSAFDFLVEVTKIEVPEVISSKSHNRQSSMMLGGSSKKPTLASIFKGSLISLMDTIRLTEVHYIRCIKPNQTKVAFEFEPQNVVQQLRACGVLETIRIYCAGYPSRMTYYEFVDKYHILVNSSTWASPVAEITTAIAQKFITSTDKYQLGLTKIFLRAGQLAYLEKLRTDRQIVCIIHIQKYVRRMIYRNRFLKTQNAILRIQTIVRGYQARKSYKKARLLNAAIKIQKYVRRYLCVKRFALIKTSIIRIQSVVRMFQAKKQFKVYRAYQASIKIQKIWRGYQTRKTFKKTIQRIVFIQSCIRRRFALKEFKILRTEARSFGKLKDTNYKLENTVIQLSQQVASKDANNRALNDRITHLEALSTSWKDKFITADAKNKNAAGHATDEIDLMRKEIISLTDSRNKTFKDHEKLQIHLKKRDEDAAKIELELIESKEEIKRLRDESKNTERIVNVAPENTSELKQQLAALQDQMKRMVAGKPESNRYELGHNRDHSLDSEQPTVLKSRLESMRSLHGSNGSIGNVSVDTCSRRVSGNYATKSEIQDKLISASNGSLNERTRTKSARSIIPESYPTGESGQKLRDILEDSALEDEIIETLINNLRIPLPSTQAIATRKEIFFPAHLIGNVMLQMISNNFTTRLYSLVVNIMKSIKTIAMKFEDDYVSAFWLSNAFEMFCIIKTAQEKERGNRRKSSIGHLHLSPGELSMDEATDRIRLEIDDLLNDLFQGWVKELKKRIGNMIIPAVIENQSLPGYICKQSGAGLWGKWGKTASATQFTIEQLLNFISKLSKTMRCYYMEDSVTRQILTELLRVVGVSSFNHVLMRKNFCTWKRGVQIQYNVSRLEEWCTSHSIGEATLHLQQLLQAAKLLTLNKTSPQDIETIFDVCFLLNPVQIKKLLSLYYAADFDSPLSPELLKIVSSRAVLNEEDDALLLDLDQNLEFIKPSPRSIESLEKFIPNWIGLPHVQSVVLANQS